AGAFQMFAPRTAELYATTMDELWAWNPLLRKNFSFSLFPAATFNLGPNTICYPHLDHGNVAFGWCVVTALGKFDHRKGGHLVLWDLGLVIQFPPGSTVLFPSAVLKHSNTSIRSGEYRYSMTQYCAGGLFRWVYNGFRTDKSINEEIAAGTYPAAAAEKRAEDRRTRWKRGLAMFSHLNEFKKTL
ncbi:hypothetical protein PLICRDRAFT_118318, partial [Plicaturopsis crispa FD-325 SS-3]